MAEEPLNPPPIYSRSLASMIMATRPGTHHLTFGYRRVEVLGAMGSILLIWILTGAVLAEAIRRVRQPENVDGFLMVIIGGIGVVFNIVMTLAMSVGGMGHTHSHGMGGAGECDHGHSHEGGASDHGDHGHSHAGSGGHGHSQEEAEHGHSHAGSHSCGATAINSTEHHGHSHSDSEATSTGACNHGHSAGDHDHDHDHDHEHEDDGHRHSSDDVSGSSTGSGGCGGRIETLLCCGSKQENLNVRAALAHALGDLAQNVAVCIAGGLIWYNPSWRLADPICTFIFSIIVIYTTFGATGEIVSVLLEAVPSRVDYHAVLRDLRRLQGVTSVHNLHIWSTSG